MALAPETVKSLEAEKKRLEQRIEDLNSQLDDVEDAIGAIDLLLGTSKPESVQVKTLKSLLKLEKTFRGQVITTVIYMERPVRPVQVAEEMAKTGLFDEKTLKSRTATEMYKMSASEAKTFVKEDGIYKMHPDFKR